jgi:hypothetical protein
VETCGRLDEAGTGVLGYQGTLHDDLGLETSSLQNHLHQPACPSFDHRGYVICHVAPITPANSLNRSHDIDLRCSQLGCRARLLRFVNRVHSAVRKPGHAHDSHIGSLQSLHASSNPVPGDTYGSETMLHGFVA